MAAAVFMPVAISAGGNDVLRCPNDRSDSERTARRRIKPGQRTIAVPDK
jgi:hypothetical protein